MALGSYCTLVQFPIGEGAHSIFRLTHAVGGVLEKFSGNKGAKAEWRLLRQKNTIIPAQAQCCPG
jgi:hypothetical protein